MGEYYSKFIGKKLKFEEIECFAQGHTADR